MDFQQKRIITPEKKKENEAKLKCRVCGKKIIGKETLSRHLAHAHDEISEVRREKIVIDTYYGKQKVDSVIKDFENGKYKTIHDLPINIYKYINLAGIVKGSARKKEELDKFEKDDDKKEVVVTNNGQNMETLILKNQVTEEKAYVEEGIYNSVKNTLTLIGTKKFEDSLTIEQLREFLEETEIKTSKIFVKLNDEISKISSIEIINVDNGGEDSDKDSKTGYSQCVVTYLPQSSSSDEIDKILS